MQQSTKRELAESRPGRINFARNPLQYWSRRAICVYTSAGAQEKLRSAREVIIWFASWLKSDSSSCCCCCWSATSKAFFLWLLEKWDSPTLPARLRDPTSQSPKREASQCRLSNAFMSFIPSRVQIIHEPHKNTSPRADFLVYCSAAAAAWPKIFKGGPLRSACIIIFPYAPCRDMCMRYHNLAFLAPRVS